MADLRTLGHRCHSCLGALPADHPDACSACGPSYRGVDPPRCLLSEASLERARLAGELRPSGPDMAIRVELAMPADDRTDWAWTDVGEYVTRNDPPELTVIPSQATFAPTGGLYYPPPPRRWRIARLIPAPGVPWWRRIWRRR